MKIRHTLGCRSFFLRYCDGIKNLDCEAAVGAQAQGKYRHVFSNSGHQSEIVRIGGDIDETYVSPIRTISLRRPAYEKHVPVLTLYLPSNSSPFRLCQEICISNQNLTIQKRSICFHQLL